MLSLLFPVGEDDNLADPAIIGNESTFTCSDDFFPIPPGKGPCRCAAHCPDWKQYSYSVSKLIDKVVLVCSIIGVLSACAVLVIACIRHKEM